MQILEADFLTNDLEATEKFYSNTLGLRLIERQEESILFSCGRSILRFVKTKNETEPVYHFAFSIPYANFKEAVTWASIHLNLINVENENVIAEFVNWNARAVYFYDNNKNILEFISRVSEEVPVQAAFSTESIQQIAEVGIVTDNVLNFARQLNSSYKIDTYEKQPLHNTFGALGDDEGLLILSAPGRHWYPTTKIAEPFYTKIKIMHNKQLLELTFNEVVETSVKERKS